MAIYNVHGAQLSFDDGGGPQNVAQLETITLPTDTRTSEEFPTHDQPTGSFTARLTAALRTAGEFTFGIIEDFTEASHNQTTGLLSLFGNAAAVDWTVTLADGSVITFAGWLANRTPAEMPANLGAARVQYTIQLEAGYAVTPAT